MRCLFLILIFLAVFSALAPLSAQDAEEPHFGDAVEILNVESPVQPTPEEIEVYPGLTRTNHLTADQAKRAVRSTDGKVYPWPDSFDRIALAAYGEEPSVYVYEGNVFLLNYDSKNQNVVTYWTLNLDTGVYSPRAENTVSTFCGIVPVFQLTSRWFFRQDGDETRLCSPYGQRLSSPLPDNYKGFIWYDGNGPMLITESPSGKTVVFLAILKDVVNPSEIYFRYDVAKDTFTELQAAVIVHESGAGVEWPTDDILLVRSHSNGNYASYGPVLNVVDLRYNDVTIISGDSLATQDDQLVVTHDPLQVVVKDLFYMELHTGDSDVEHVYCRDTIYDLMSTRKWEWNYWEFCHQVGGERYGVGYYLLDGQLWRYQRSELSGNGYLMVNDPIDHIQQLSDKTLLIYTEKQVLQLDTAAENAVPEVLFDHPALWLVNPSKITPSATPIHYFITAEGLLRVNTDTDEQVLVFKGLVSRVNQLDLNWSLVELIYQEPVDNFPTYIAPTIYQVDAFDQPNYSRGNLALVSLKTGEIIFETPVDWEKQRELYEGFWRDARLEDWGDGWFHPERSSSAFQVSAAGELVRSVQVDDGGVPISRADDWLLVQNNEKQVLSLLNPITGKTIFVADKVSYPDIHYEGNGEFSLQAYGKTYHFRVSEILD